MPFDATFTKESDYLRLEVSGVRVPGELTKDMLEVWTKLAEQCRATGMTRVLCINRLTGPVPALEVYNIGQQVPRILGNAVHRVAMVVLGGEEAVRANLFFENVAVNRGAFGRVFEDEAQALAWLMSP